MRPDKSKHPFVADTKGHHLQQPFVVHVVVEPLDVRLDHPVHALLHDVTGKLA